MTQSNTVPDGYLKDSQGRLVPLDMIKPLDLARDELVNSLMADALTQQGQLANFRKQATDKIDAFVNKCAKKYGTTMGGAQGNLTMHTYDGECKITVSIAKEIVFNEGIQIAKKLIDECISEWAEGTRPELKVLVDQAFQATDDGSLSASKILGLRKLKIKDTKWNRAMRALNDSIESGSKKPYIRFYKKDESGEFQNVPLDIAKLAEVA